jgi:ferredoxin
MVNGPAKSQFHVKYPSPMAMSGFLVRVFATFKPQLTIADAIIAMEGNGPAHGRPRAVGVLLASRDAVALDTVACTALRILPTTVPMIRLAAAGNMGIMDASGIERTGSGRERLESIRLKPSLARYLGRIPEPFFALTPRLFRLRPKIKNLLCEKCGACVRTCPKNAIRNDPRTGYPVINHSECIDCFCCLESCPPGAIAAQFYMANTLCLAQRMRERTVAP